jgi:hypothetical protein
MNQINNGFFALITVIKNGNCLIMRSIHSVGYRLAALEQRMTGRFCDREVSERWLYRHSDTSVGVLQTPPLVCYRHHFWYVIDTTFENVLSSVSTVERLLARGLKPFLALSEAKNLKECLTLKTI